MGPHIREGVKDHELHIESKFCKVKVLGKLVI